MIRTEGKYAVRSQGYSFYLRESIVKSNHRFPPRGSSRGVRSHYFMSV